MIKAMANSKNEIDMALSKAEFEANAALFRKSE